MSALAAAVPTVAPALRGTPLADLPALLLPAYGQTLLMVGIVMALVVALGTPLGVVVFNTGPGGLFPAPRAHTALSWVVNLGRSLPFLILMAAIIPVTRLLVGTTIGIPAAVVPMTVAGVPFFARLVENALRDVPVSVTEVARVSGGSPWQVVRRAQLHEAVPAIIGSATVNTIAMIEYSAIAGTIGAGGIGYVAVTYGYQRFDHSVMVATIVVLVATVAAVQFAGDRLARRATPHLRRA
ncbi:methionine ABC transporter permease [Kineococcus glutinatus]|uniref:ABC transporter permease n=1 Tax=Kineococcus glutinatus TaxID=1070872 RepID=A0ABP9H7P1_9ACTN